MKPQLHCSSLLRAHLLKSLSAAVVVAAVVALVHVLYSLKDLLAQSLSDIKLGQGPVYFRAFRAAPARRALEPSWGTATHVGLCLCCVSHFLTVYSRALDIFVQLQRLFAVDIKPCFF